jgi:hypothetical protein
VGITPHRNAKGAGETKVRELQLAFLYSDNYYMEREREREREEIPG